MLRKENGLSESIKNHSGHRQKLLMRSWRYFRFKETRWYGWNAITIFTYHMNLIFHMEKKETASPSFSHQSRKSRLINMGYTTSKYIFWGEKKIYKGETGGCGCDIVHGHPLTVTRPLTKNSEGEFKEIFKLKNWLRSLEEWSNTNIFELGLSPHPILPPLVY